MNVAPRGQFHSGYAVNTEMTLRFSRVETHGALRNGGIQERDRGVIGLEIETA